MSVSDVEMSRKTGADIFCRVIDNFGDAGVCWRLARRLAQGYGWRVRLWIDQPELISRFQPGSQLRKHGSGFEGVEVRAWSEPFPEVSPHAVAIEAFGCDLPASYSQRISPEQVWINLEYLSAESWVESCHALPSPQGAGRQKYFFFPGFTEQTGGLLREPGLLDARDQFQRNRYERDAFLHGLGVPLTGFARADTATSTQPADQSPLLVSLFCYPHAPVRDLVSALSAASRPVVLLRAYGTCPALEAGSYGNLQVVNLPFLSQDDFDRLLWSCDVNFIRGEDSFVRAQWAARPLCWHIYPQSEEAHLVKLDAWLQRYSSLEEVHALHAAWNGGSRTTTSFRTLLEAVLRPGFLEQWRTAARAWSTQLARQPDLADKLVGFCRQRLKY